jgi:hypothetical protein
MRKLWLSDTFWEVIGYINIMLLVFGQITVGYLYIPAQAAYLVANALSLIRCIVLKQPKADIIRNAVFTAITIALIVIYIF